jgi:hypothetical protein
VVGVARNQKIAQIPCENVIREFQTRYEFQFFQRFIFHFNPGMLSAASGQKRSIIQQVCAHLMRS